MRVRVRCGAARADCGALQRMVPLWARPSNSTPPATEGEIVMISHSRHRRINISIRLSSGPSELTQLGQFRFTRIR